MNTYYPGQLVKLAATFTVGGVDTDPTAVTLTVQNPLSVQTIETVTRDGVGAYHFDIDLTNANLGVWLYEWTGTGPAQGAAIGQFYVGNPFP